MTLKQIMISDPTCYLTTLTTVDKGDGSIGAIGKQIMISDPTCYLTTLTTVDKGDGSIGAIGNEGAGTIVGTDWYAIMDWNGTTFKASRCYRLQPWVLILFKQKCLLPTQRLKGT
jgi:hypothetical protein